MIKTLTKRIIGLTFIAGMTVSAAFSQYTLQTNNIPGPYDKWDFKLLADTSVQPGPGGAGVLWDFSLYSVTVNTKTDQYERPSSSGVDATFIGANMKKQSYLGWTEYYTKNAAGTEIQFLGLQSSANEVYLSNTQKLITLPFTYGSSISNAPLAGTGLFGSTVSGTITVVGDGYGTLKVGGFTFNSVTRVKTDINIVEDLGGQLSNVRLIKYSWYKTGTNAPYFEIVDLHTSGLVGDNTQKYGLVIYRMNVGVDDLSKPNLSFNVSPNPVRSEATIHLNIDRSSDVTCQIMDITGRIALTQTSKLTSGEHEIKMDVSELPKGVYILSAISGTVNRQQRIIISE